MKLSIKLTLILFLFSIFIFGDRSFSLTNYDIRKICKKEKKGSKCFKNLQEKRLNFKKGNLIEIPVIPYKR